MVLVTGATGLVGSHLVLHLLERHEKVRAIFRNEISIEKTKSLFKLYQKEALFDKIEWVQADITEVTSLTSVFQNIDYVYHCAALISFDPKDEAKLRKINIEGTANIVNFCLDFHIKKLCFVSSIAALGDLNTNETIVTEKTEWNPEYNHSDYSISKYGAEMEIWRGQQEGLKVVIVNPGVILGPCFWDTGSGTIFNQVANGLPFYTKGSVGFVTVNDVVKILFQLMKSDQNGERFILFSSIISYESLLKTIAKILKVKPPFIFVKPWITELIWRLDWVRALMFQSKRKLSKTMSNSLHKNILLSNDKIKKELNYQFEDIEEYLIELEDFYPNK